MDEAPASAARGQWLSRDLAIDEVLVFEACSLGRAPTATL
jgi:hypothetical protein